jgi:hypothetical protein
VPGATSWDMATVDRSYEVKNVTVSIRRSPVDVYAFLDVTLPSDALLEKA